MLKLFTCVKDKQLIIRRNRTRDIAFFVGIGAINILLAIFCFSTVERHYISPDFRIRFVPLLLFGIVFSWRSFTTLRGQSFVFDKVLGQLTLNNQPIQTIDNLQSICLERSFYNHTATLSLYLCTKSQVKIELAHDGLFGLSELEMRSIATAIAKYVGIDWITPETFVPGSRNRDLILGVRNKLGKKRRHTLLLRRAKTQLHMMHKATDDVAA